jgi:hypothetical protein
MMPGASLTSWSKVAHRWKAPRVRLISLFFAEERVMRPLAPGGVRVIRTGVVLATFQSGGLA